MTRMQVLIILGVSLCLVPGASKSYAGTSPDRQIAVTIDDLPAGNANFMSATDITQMTTKLLAALQQQKIPAVGFVNEKKLYRPGEVDERIKALDLWLDAGDGAVGASAPARRDDPAVAGPADGLGARILDLQWRELALDTRTLRNASASGGTMDSRALDAAVGWRVGLGGGILDQLSRARHGGGVSRPSPLGAGCDGGEAGPSIPVGHQVAR